MPIKLKNTVCVTIVTLIVLVNSSFSARILGVVPTPSYSHQVAFYPIWKELSLRGHQVTLLTTDPMKDSSLTNLTQINLSVMYQTWKTMDVNQFSKLNPIEMANVMVELGVNLTDYELQHPDVQKLIKNEKEHFDVALVETIFPAMVVFAERFKCPLIQILSVDAPTINHYLIGSPGHPVLNPDFMLPFSGKLSFLERLASTAYYCFIVPFSRYKLLPAQDLVVKKYFGNNMPSVEEILSNSSLTFVNTDLVFHPIRPLLPNVIQIGGGTHVTAGNPLPKDLQNVVDSAKNGFIYFSLGSNVKSSMLSEDIRKIFLDTFADLPYTILWKFEQEHLPGKPDNVFISKWFPQQDIFKQPNIKLFISQGGLQSMDEAVHNHIPIIGIPFMGDQGNNVRRMEGMGIGIGLSVETLDKSNLKTAIWEVLNNPRYRNKVKELAELSKDQPMTGLDRAIWWTEYVIRHKGARHLRSPALDLPAYQYYLLDVLGFCSLILIAIIYILAKLVRLVVKVVRYCVPKPKTKKQ